MKLYVGVLGVLLTLMIILAAVSVMRISRTESLVIAAGEGDLATMRRMIAHGADVNEIDPNSGDTPLFRAVFNQQFEAANFLVDQGALSKRKTSQGSPFEIARSDEMRRILKKAADWK